MSLSFKGNQVMYCDRPVVHRNDILVLTCSHRFGMFLNFQGSKWPAGTGPEG